MNTRSVYIETSIVSYLGGRASRDLLLAACQQATRDWWQDHRARYELFTSQLVVAEAAAGDPELAKKRLAYLEGIPELQVTTEVGDLARALVTEGAFPPKAQADALHIAVAAIHRMDLLLTWNCRHIDNPTTKPKVRSVCLAAGYTCPEICTPIEMLEAASDEE
jgi:predicted nucleic acid-binding protein